MSAVDFVSAVMWVAGLAFAGYWLWPRPRRVHRWGELDSSDVVTAIRRVRRPR